MCQAVVCLVPLSQAGHHRRHHRKNERVCGVRRQTVHQTRYRDQVGAPELDTNLHEV